MPCLQERTSGVGAGGSINHPHFYFGFADAEMCSHLHDQRLITSTSVPRSSLTEAGEKGAVCMPDQKMAVYAPGCITHSPLIMEYPLSPPHPNTAVQ